MMMTGIGLRWKFKQEYMQQGQFLGYVIYQVFLG